jgi:hypothetical protein
MNGLEAVPLAAELTQKERVRRALCREPVDRIPTQCNYTALMGHMLAGYFKIPFGDLPARLDNHVGDHEGAFIYSGGPTAHDHSPS